MNDDPLSKMTKTAGDAAKSLASDIDPRFDPAASGGAADALEKAQKSSQQQIDEMTAACSAWVRDKPFQALAVAAGLGFLLGRVGR